MQITPDQLVSWIGTYGYFAIFGLAIIEGPIITVLSGFLASIAEINFMIAYALLIIGDLIGDSALYFLGKHSLGKNIPRWLKYFGITDQRYQFMKSKFLKHPKKILSIGKFLYGIGSLTIFMAGASKLKYRTFFIYDLLFTASKTFVFLLIGYFFGQAYEQIQKDFDYAAWMISGILIITFIVFILYSREYLEKQDYIEDKDEFY